MKGGLGVRGWGFYMYIKIISNKIERKKDFNLCRERKGGEGTIE